MGVSLVVREEEKAEHERRMARIEAGTTEVFQRKVEQKHERLRQTEQTLERRIEKDRSEVAAARQELDHIREQFQREKKIFEKAKSASMGDLLREGKGKM